jgi:septal ring factor EnvC (AmiA/AmiB activator)
VYAGWKNHKKNNATAFLLSAKDFNTATRRLSWLRSYNRARVEMGVEIDSLSALLQADIKVLSTKKAELESAKIQKDREMTSLSNDEKAHNASLKELQKDRKKLEAQAKKERETIAAAQKEIDRIIAAQVKAGKGQRTEADVILTGKFEDNKGLLPWPVGSSATVLDHFGVNRMADGVAKNSSGLSIAAPRGAAVRAIFEGKVTGVYNIGQFDKCISIRSGNYIVVYGNLATTTLKSGDAVAINQSVGKLSDADNADKHLLLLQIWRETTPLDPEVWLK